VLHRHNLDHMKIWFRGRLVDCENRVYDVGR